MNQARISPLLRHNVGATMRRFAMLLSLVTLGSATLLALTAVLGSAVSDAATHLDTQSGLSVIDVRAISPRGPARELTAQAVQQIRATPGVEAAVPYGQVGMSVIAIDDVEPGQLEALSGVLWATPRIPWTQPTVSSTAAGTLGRDLGDDQVLLPDVCGGVHLAGMVGRHITVEYIRATGAQQGEPREATLTVAGLYDNAHPGADGESAAYLSTSTFSTMLAASIGAPGASVPPGYGYPSVVVKVTSTGAVSRVEQHLTAQGFHAEAAVGSAGGLPGILGLLSRADAYLGLALLLFCLAVGASVGGTWSVLRRWDVGLLSALGWSRRRILVCYTTELGLVGLAVGVAGIALGVVAAAVTVALWPDRAVLGVHLTDGFTLHSVWWCAAVLIGVPVALLSGALPRIAALAGVDPQLALRRSD